MSKNWQQRFWRLSVQDKILFAKRLSLLIKAGVPITQSLAMLTQQSRTSSSSNIMQALLSGVEGGKYLSQSMRPFAKVFGDFAVSVVEVGETSGTLQENLQYLGEEWHKNQQLKRKVRGALLYPLFVLVGTIGIVALLTLYVFPKVLPIFQSLDFQLPWTTRLLIFVSNGVLHHWLLLLCAFALLIVAIVLLLRIERVRYVWHRTLLRVPILGTMLHSYYLANFARTFGLLLKSELNIVRAMEITAGTMTNLALQYELLVMVTRLKHGEKVSTYMEGRPKFFPSMLTQMVAVGERTGSLSHSLFFLAELYEQEVEDATKNLTTVIEPALMVGMGVLVGFVAISIITPIYGITQSLHP